MTTPNEIEKIREKAFLPFVQCNPYNKQQVKTAIDQTIRQVDEYYILKSEAIPKKVLAEKIKELKKWCDKQHIHEFSKKAEDCDFNCWGKTFPKEIDNIFKELLCEDEK